MRISRRQLSLLIENYLKQPQLLFEIKKKAFNQFIQRGLVSQQEFDMLVFNKDWVPPFNDPIMAKILFNTLNADQGHSINDIKAVGEEVINRIIANARSGELKPRLIRGTSNEYIDILPMIDVTSPDNTIATYNDVMKYLENASGLDKRGDLLTQTIQDGINGQKSEFEVVAMPSGGQKYFVSYPKTYKGSIALGRMGPDYRYYNPNKPDDRAVLGAMTWCTTVDGSGNMFLNYHRNMNLHMYYLTRIDGYNPSNRDRKFCLSFAKDRGGNVMLHEDGHATVDGNNSPASKDYIISIIGQRLYSIIENDVKNPSRAVIDPVKYYRSINLDQYQAMRAASQTGPDLDLFKQEASNIADHTENREIIYDMVKDSNISISGIGLAKIKDVEGTKFALEHHDMNKIIRSKAPLDSKMIQELYKEDKIKNRGMSSSFLLYHLLRRTFNYYKSGTPATIIDDLILDDIVDDVVSGNFISGSAHINASRSNSFEDGTIYRVLIRQPNLTTEHMHKIYDNFSKERSIDSKGNIIVDLISLPNCPKEIFDKELNTRLTLKMRKPNTYTPRSEVNEIGESPRVAGIFARRLASQAGKDFLSKLSPETMNNFIHLLAIVPGDALRGLMGNFDLSPIVAIKAFERALHIEEDFYLVGPQEKVDALKEQELKEKIEKMAEYISIFVDPKKASYLDEIYGDMLMEVDYPLSDMPGGRASEFNKVWSKVYGEIPDVGEYLSEIVAYMQEYEDEPENDVQFYNDSILRPVSYTHLTLPTKRIV